MDYCLQRAVSECLSLLLIMTCYLIINDDLIFIKTHLKILVFHKTFPYFSILHGDPGVPLVYNYLQLNYKFNPISLHFSESIVLDFLGTFSKFLICFFSFLYFLIIANSLKEQKLTNFEYLLIILFAILGLIVMCSCNDLLTAYLSIELSSLAFYILASFKKTSSYSVEGGVKYFITGAVSSAFFLLGSSFIYGTVGSINFRDFSDLFAYYKTFEYSIHFGYIFLY